MKVRTLIPILFLAFAVLGITACKDKFERIPCNGTDPTWNGEVQDIIATYCWAAGCHGTGATNGDFTSYDGIKARLNDNSFEVQIFETRAMPQNESLPDSILATLQCWLENGFPEV